jgi:molecular chaperone GrpE
MEKEPEELKKKCNEYLDGWKRERASFINYKKEEMERMEGIIKYANEELIFKMLSILDSMALAEKNIPGDLKKDENVKGLLNIYKQVKDFLKCQGVEEISSLNEKFDPNIHEAVEEVESKDTEPGVIIEEVQKGYKLNDKLLRPTRVKISK